MEFTGSGSIAARLLLMLSFVLLFSMSSAHATPPPVQYPTITCSSPVSNPPPSYQGMPGEWNNSLRYGTGWEIDYYTVPGQTLPQLVVTWLTYDQSHRPIWLSAGPVPYDKTSLQWTAPMYKSTWAPNIGAGAHTVVQVGQVSIKFSNSSSTTAAIKWQWDEYSTTAWQPDECISNVESDSTGVNTALTAPTLGGIDQSYSGAWSDVTHSGWGLTEAVGLQPAGNVELQTLEIYDVAGNAVWLQAQNGPQSTPIPTSQISQTPPLWYYGSTYAVNTACSSSSCRGVEIQVGSANRTFTSNVAETFTVSVRQTTTLPGTQIGWPNSAFLFPTTAPPVTYSPETATSNLQKYVPIPYLYVSQTNCTLTGSQTSCPVIVSWTNTADSTARVYELNRSTSQYVIPSTNNDGSGCTPSPTQAISTAYTGSVKVCLPPSADVQFELHSGGSPSGTLLLTSPEVKVSAAQLPNSATFQSQTLSATNNTMQSGQTYNVSVTMLNSGQSTWTATAGYALAPITPAGNTNWVTTSVPLPTNTSVAPGGTYTFQFSVTAPYVASPPTYDFQWQMAQIVQGNSTFFGVPSDDLKITVNTAPLSATCGVETVVIAGQPVAITGGTIPSSNPVLTAGQTYAATVAIKNTGSSTWTTAALDQLGSQYPAGNSIWVPGGVVALPGSIAPGATATFTFNIVAPTAGLYWYQWQMQQGSATPFGQICPPQYIQTVAPAIPLPPPAVTTSPASSTETTPAFNLTWGPGSTSANPAPTYYMLQYSTTPTGTPALINGNIPVTGSSNVYAVTMPISGTYYFQVAACYPQGCSGFTESAAVVVTLPPTRPENVGVTQASASSDSFTLNWTQPTTVTPAASYSIQQATAATGPWTPASSAGTACTSGSCTSTITVTGPGTYYYEVAACAGASGTNCSVYARGTNVAKGGTASATSTYPGYPVSSIVDGDRTGYKWGNGGGWNSGTAGAFPDTATVTWTPAKTIQSVVVYTLQDNFFADVDPSDTMAFSAYGLTAFDVQVDTAGVWTTVATVTNSTLVKQTVTFPAVSATGVQIITHKAADGQYSRIVEVEALTLGSAVVTLPGYASTFVSQSVPSTMIAGQSYNVSVTMENTGTNTWTTATNYKLGSQNPQDNFTWGLQRVALPLNASITTGQIVTFSFTVVAPAASPIPYDFQWGTLQEGVTWFGSYSTDQKVTVTSPPVQSPAKPTAPGLATAPASDPISDAVGATAGSFSVDQQGNATYQIPIYAPRGRGGLTPSISLSYNSGSGDGLLGWGWTLGGISSITPCRQTQEHGDGANVQNLVQLDPTQGEVFCLDGERMLLLPGSGSNGAVGAQYRLESDNQTLIVVQSVVSFGTTLPSAFAVYGKDGTVRYYGNNSASSNPTLLGYSPSLNSGPTNIAGWYESSLSDSNGNTAQFNYTCARNAVASSVTNDSPDCSLATDATRDTVAIVPRSVTWVGGEIDFDTMQRPTAQQSVNYMVSTGYSIPVTQLYRVTGIHVRSPDGTELRHYTPTVSNSADNPNVQQITGFQECAGTTCYAPTNFLWKNLGASITGQSTTSGGSAPFHNVSGSSFRFGDVDGDGRSDVVWLDTSSGGTFHVSLSKPTSQGINLSADSCPAAGCPQSSIWGNDATRGHNPFWQLVDFNGDGRADLLNIKQVNASTYEWDIWLSNGSGFPDGDSAHHLTNVVVSPTASLSSAPGPMTLFGTKGIASSYMADFDGDGLPDLLVVEDSSSEVYLLKPTGIASRPYVYQGPYLAASNTNAACHFQGISSVTFQGAIAANNFRVGDFDGDGRADVVAEFSTTACAVGGVTPSSGSAGTLQVLLSAGHDNTNFYFNPTLKTWPIGLDNCNDPTGASCDRGPASDSLFQVIDLNGDGLADVVFGDSAGDPNAITDNKALFIYEINNSEFSGPATCVISGCTVSGGAAEFQVGDYDGDGKGDVWLPQGSGTNLYTIYKYTGAGFDSGTVSPLYASDISYPPNRIAFQVDLDGDGYPDTLSIDMGQGTWAATRFSSHHSARNVITQITSGLGAQTQITYSPLTFSSVYDREYTAWQLSSGWGGSVQDILSARYVVQYVESSAPTAASPENLSAVTYHYGGYKVQGFGRGPLGFHNVYTLDQQTNIVTQTTYNQAFPLTGTPAMTAAYAAPAGSSPLGTDACLSTPDSASCMVYGSALSALPGQLLNQTQDTWQWHVRGTANFGSPSLPSPGVPILVERTGSQSFKYEINDGTLISASSVTMGYDNLAGGESYGNVMSSTTGEYSSATMSASSLLRQTALTNGAYLNDTTLPHWYLGRLLTSSTQVTSYANGTATGSVSRNSSFAYDANTGLLIDEHLQPGGSSDQALDKYHIRDTYGNEVESITCSAVAGCSSSSPLSASSMTFNSSSPTWVQRYSRSDYTTSVGVFPAGVYANGTYAPFSNGSSGAVEAQTLKVNGRDEFGNVTDSTDVHGVETTGAFGSLGRQYFAATSTGGAATTIYRWCTGHAPVGVTTTVSCPTPAVYRIDTSYSAGGTARAPETWTYFDLLARQVLSVEQGFSASQYIAASQDYDSLGRVANVSEPYFTYAPTAANVGAANGSSIYKTVTSYDVLGRVVQLTHPNLTVTRTQYAGLGSTTTLPTNGSGYAQTKTLTKNLLGQLASVTDSLGSTITNTYDPSGNALTITRNGFDGKIASSAMTYDQLGRKKTLIDPDLGSWSYAYNALGEQVQQSSATTCMSSSYDGQGRIFAKTDYATAACTGTADISASWIYDTASNGLGELSQSSGTDNGITTTRQPQYDAFGRPSQVTTLIGAATYLQRSTYDQFGRPFQTFFSGAGQTETGELYLYNSQGYAYQTQDGENGTVGQVYRTILGMDQRGNVISETRAGNSSLATSRGYDPAMGWLTSIQTGTLQNLAYTYDSLGNQLTRADSSAGAASINEGFGYDALERLTSQTGTAPTTWTYDSFGNATTGSATYATKASGCATTDVTPGPDAISQVSGNQYCYDAHGNQTRTLGSIVQTNTYSSDDKLRTVETSTSGHTTAWSYGPERGRVARLDYANAAASGTPLTTHYVGDAEITGVGTSSPSIKRYLPGLILTQVSDATQLQYLFTDNLGSTHRITDNNGNPYSPNGSQRFGAFGQRTDPGSDVTLAPASAEDFDTTLTHHGFTGQEQMDESGLVHMNGRVYSSGTTRFTSPDPFVQDATDLQALNRYTYVLNNPLVHTDPSGYWGKKEQGYLREAVGIAIAAYTGYYYSPTNVGGFLAAPAAASATQTAAASIASGYLSGFVSSGNLNGAVMGALSAGANFAVGQAFPGGEIGTQAWLENAGAHAVAGGVLAELQGGKFGHGFVTAGAGAALSPAYSRNAALGTIEAAIIGGTLSEVTGGKFANGALTAAFQVMAEDAAQAAESASEEKSSGGKQDLSGVPTDALRQKMTSDDPQDRLDAANAAIDYFHIKGTGYSLMYSSTTANAGLTYPNGNIVLGNGAYSSWSYLGATLGHEIEVHWNLQMSVRGPVSSDQDRPMREIQAYDYNLRNAARFGNSDFEIQAFQNFRAGYYSQLTNANRQLIDRKIYYAPGW